ncbi:hypothetical protein TGAMA5MH_06867 [Trichoderma gamsii]|uniref:Uncharacterized protein n=1 Tax=Trichoderma gamsii TaxID=398673 RepID=A0A2K0T666_9HYPO|nr:hypothetical protein TGAMA5MH_06867 [Trichoderma gamsii]
MEYDSLPAEKAAANEEFQHSGNNEPSHSQADSDWLQVILHVDGDLLPGFDLDHIRSMATDDSPGLRVDILARPGTLAVPLLLMRLQIKCGETWHRLANIAVPFSENGTPLFAHHLHVRETTAMKAFFTLPSTYISSTTVLDPTNGLDFDLMRLGLPDPQHDSAPSCSSTFVCPQGDEIIWIYAETKAGQVVVDYPSSFWRQIHRQSMATRTVANRIKSLLSSTNPESPKRFWITFPLYQEWRRDWRLFFGDGHKESPYGRVVGEYQADNTSNNPFRSLLIPLPDSEWIAKENDKEEYGTGATGLPTAYLMAVDMETVQNAMPDIGTLVEVDLSVAQGYFKIPKQPQTPLHIRKIAVEVQRVIKAAEHKVQNAADEIQTKLSGIRDKEAIAEDVVHLISEFYVETAAKGLVPYINKLSNKAKAKHPSGPEDAQRWVDALEVASQLRARSGENDNAHVKRIAKWVKSQGVNVRTLKRSKYGEPFLGYRLDPPCNIPAEVALFHLEVPKQPDWPHGFKKPPLRIAISKNVPTDESPVGAHKMKDFYLAKKAEAVEVECLEIRVMDNLKLDHITSDQLKATIQKIASVIITKS